MGLDYSKYDDEVLAVTCKRCGQGYLKRCTDRWGRQAGPHAVRIRTAKGSGK